MKSWKHVSGTGKWATILNATENPIKMRSEKFIEFTTWSLMLVVVTTITDGDRNERLVGANKWKIKI